MLARLLFAALLLSSAPAVFAAATSPAVRAPVRGMSMAFVRKRFGAPERVLPPAPATAQGPLKPPIVRWIYPHYVVYFERGRVIDSVPTNPRLAPTPATSANGRQSGG